MIATAPISSVSALAEQAAREEGVSLADLIANRPRRNVTTFEKRSPRHAAIFSVVCAKVTAAGVPYPEVGRVFGTSHSTIFGAAQRGHKILNARAVDAIMAEQDRLRAIGQDIADGLPADCPPGTPMYDDGESEWVDGRGQAEGSKATRYKKRENLSESPGKAA